MGRIKNPIDLSEAKQRVIIELKKKKNTFNRQLAKKYKCDKNTIRNVLKRPGQVEKENLDPLSSEARSQSGRHLAINEQLHRRPVRHTTKSDYSVGFGRSAFTEEQLKKLEPFVGEIGSKAFTYFMATARMHFPFLTCEVKCGAAALDVADRQNAHSMTIAVKGVIEIYRAVKREKELYRAMSSASSP